MTELGVKIIELRKLNKPYRQIAKELKCATSLVGYYLDKNQREKYRIRQYNSRKKRHPFVLKVQGFLYENKRVKVSMYNSKFSVREVLITKFYSFRKSKKGTDMMESKLTVEDVLKKFGENPKCYLTGEDIDIHKSRMYEFDHIIPRSKGVDNNIDNLGICSRRANRAKNDMTPDEFIMLCKTVLEHNGYKINKEEKK